MMGSDKLYHHLSYPMLNQIGDKISDGIYYPSSFLLPFHIRYVNLKLRGKIHISHIS